MPSTQPRIRIQTASCDRLVQHYSYLIFLNYVLPDYKGFVEKSYF